MLVSWKQLMEDVEKCEACGLCKTLSLIHI